MPMQTQGNTLQVATFTHNYSDFYPDIDYDPLLPRTST